MQTSTICLFDENEVEQKQCKSSDLILLTLEINMSGFHSIKSFSCSVSKNDIFGTCMECFWKSCSIIILYVPGGFINFKWIQIQIYAP